MKLKKAIVFVLCAVLALPMFACGKAARPGGGGVAGDGKLIPLLSMSARRRKPRARWYIPILYLLNRAALAESCPCLTAIKVILL